MNITLFGPSTREEIIELTGDPEELDIRSEEYAIEDEVRVVCRITRSGELVRVQGEAFARFSAQCARCLDEFEIDVRGTFLFVAKRMPLGVPVPHEEESSDEEKELVYLEHDAVSFDISDHVRDAVILALPMKILCREDCKGLCVVCGSNQNESECGCDRKCGDERWRNLEKLFEKE